MEQPKVVVKFLTVLGAPLNLKRCGARAWASLACFSKARVGLGLLVIPACS